MGQGIGQGLSPLIEGSPDQGEHELLVRIHRRLFKGPQAEDGAVHAGPGDKGRGRDDQGHLRCGIVGHGQGNGPVVAASGPGLDSVRHLLLDHDGDGFKAALLFQKFHQDGRGHVIGKVGHHLQGPSTVIVLYDPLDIRLQDILPDDIHVVAFRECICQDGFKARVDLHADHPSRCTGKELGHGTYTGTDLQDAVLLRDPGGINNAPDDPFVDQEILTVFFLGMNTVFFKYLPRSRGRGKQLAQMEASLLIIYGRGKRSPKGYSCPFPFPLLCILCPIFFSFFLSSFPVCFFSPAGRDALRSFP